MKNKLSPLEHRGIRILVKSSSKDQKNQTPQKEFPKIHRQKGVCTPQKITSSQKKTISRPRSRLSSHIEVNNQKVNLLPQRKLRISSKQSESQAQKKQPLPTNFQIKLLFNENQKQNDMQSQRNKRKRLSENQKNQDQGSSRIFDGPYTDKSFLRGVYFEIHETVSVKIDPFGDKIDKGAQTLEFTLDDKYYLDYMRYRNSKAKSFELIQERETKLKEILKENEGFEKKHQELLKYIEQGPSNHREQRVFGLSIDLQKQQLSLKGLMDSLRSHILLANQSQLFEKMRSWSLKISSLIESINLLGKVFGKQLKSKGKESSQESLQSVEKDATENTKRVLEKIQGELHEIRDIKNFHKYLTMIETFYSASQGLSTEYEELTNLQYQNRVLLYNFIQQIIKIPTLSSKLFGQRLQQSEKGENQANFQENLFEVFMSVNCQRCYETKRKIDMLKILNAQSMPYFKVAEWLIRDCSKQKPLIGFI